MTVISKELLRFQSFSVIFLATAQSALNSYSLHSSRVGGAVAGRPRPRRRCLFLGGRCCCCGNAHEYVLCRPRSSGASSSPRRLHRPRNLAWPRESLQGGQTWRPRVTEASTSIYPEFTFDDFVVIVRPERVVLVHDCPVGIVQGQQRLVSSYLQIQHTCLAVLSHDYESPDTC